MAGDQQSLSPLKVLVSAYACEPGKGSEPGVGWNVARELSSRVSLWVITRANNQTAIEGSGEAWTKQVRWIYWDPPAWLTFWKRGGRGVQLFYLIWQYGVKAVADKALAECDFDVIHHLTFGKYWIPSRLAALPRPFVLGPVGGGEMSPPGLVGGSGWGGALADGLKRIATWTATHYPPSLRLLRAAAWTFAATPQTEETLRQAKVSKVSVLPQSGIRASDLPETGGSRHGSVRDELVLVSASRLIHWKAVDLAIEAVAAASKMVAVRLVVLQTGPELAKLRRLADRLGIGDKVDFKGKLRCLGDVYEEISKADALVHPALHEAFGQACLEALALGVPVICLNWGGPGLIVDAHTGFAVEPGSRTLTVARLAQAMEDLASERDAGVSRNRACQDRAFKQFDWANIAEEMVACYRRILAETGRL
jgi:glycosyltransferase involved in cell wall biosynthesis